MKAAGVVLTILGALFLVCVGGFAMSAAEGPRFTQWCAEQGGVTPNGWFSDPICVRDGLVLIPPKGSNARWPE